MSYRILVIGLGDLGQRLAADLSTFDDLDELVLAGRRVQTGVHLAGLLDACGKTKVRFTELDASQQSAVERLLRRERPDLVVQCASLLSPWYLSDCPHPTAKVLQMAGFAAQLPAQLPLIATLMAAVRVIDFQGPVVNCSYPDLTHPVLACIGLAPTLGIGNVGMIQLRVQAVLRERGAVLPQEERSPIPLVRVLAHHSHVRAVMLSCRPQESSQCPQVFLGQDGLRADDLAYAGVPLPLNRHLNALSAASGLPILRALLPDSLPLRTSAPGPLGLPGGYPIRIVNGSVELDLPDGLSAEAAIRYQWQSAHLDGVAELDKEGTISFTESTQALLRQIDPVLSEPLSPLEARERFNRMIAQLDSLS